MVVLKSFLAKFDCPDMATRTSQTTIREKKNPNKYGNKKVVKVVKKRKSNRRIWKNNDSNVHLMYLAFYKCIISKKNLFSIIECLRARIHCALAEPIHKL